MNETVLVVDDDRALLEGIRFNLDAEGFATLCAAAGRPGLALARERRPALAVVDLMLPDISGFEVLQGLKALDPGMPVILLTARTEIHDKVSGFSLGADDYVTKPFDIRELILRIRARLRAPAVAEEEIRFGPLRIQPARHRVLDGEADLALTRTEFDLLLLLARNPGVVLTRERVFERLWGLDADYSSRAVDMHVSRLRKKIGPAGGGLIHTVTGVGYRAESPRP